ncbi:YciI family protein [Rhodanobacter soli]|uniref:YCII-related domain-containing protein n=1 Tax=Rhodanobacter soli TaxID=590609 RepID=A0ABV2PYW0_9GAMM
MNQENPSSDYLLLSRGQWDKDASREDIQAAIDQFYAWYDRLVAEGRIGPGQRLGREGKVVSLQATTDGPFAEAKEVVGGYWFIRANSLEEAARIAAENPCLAYGLVCEVRPLDLTRASAYALTNETPT